MIHVTFRKAVYWLVYVIFIYGCIEILSYSGLYFLHRYYGLNYKAGYKLSEIQIGILNDLLEGKYNYFEFSPNLGWTIEKNGSSDLYKANSSGIRSNREYSLNPPSEVIRIATFGDSFTHCDDVGNNDTWEAILENLDPQLEVLNFGVGGFGLDQAYLRYLQDGLKFKPEIVLIGFMPEDIFRNVNTFRPFFRFNTNIPLTKPRFKIKNGELVLVRNPIEKLEDYRILLLEPKIALSKIGAGDYYYSDNYKSSVFDFSPTIRSIKLLIHKISNKFGEDITENGYYNEKSEAYKITTKIFDQFYANALRHNSIPIILIFPDMEDIIRYRTLNVKQYSPLLSYFNSKGYRYIDFMEVFKRLGEDFDLNKLFSGHYSPFANKLVATTIDDYLTRNGLIDGKKKKNDFPNNNILLDFQER